MLAIASFLDAPKLKTPQANLVPKRGSTKLASSKPRLITCTAALEKNSLQIAKELG
jgi:hypothetical protein